MLFVIDRPQLQRMIALVRDDRTPAAQGQTGPYMRLEANNDSLTLAGRLVEATFPATVYEPGVLFLQVTRFRRLLQTFKGEKMLTVQVNGDGLFMGSIRMALAPYDMLLYLDPAKAPQRCPLEHEPEPPAPIDDRDKGFLWSHLEGRGESDKPPQPRNLPG